MRNERNEKLEMKMRNEEMKLSEHFTLGELCKTSVKTENVPNEEQVNNLKRLCGWLEQRATT